MRKKYAVYYAIGATGPIGPTGPSTGLQSYDGRYNNTFSNITLGILNQTQIPLSLTMPNLNTTYTNANSITINQAGTYELIFIQMFQLQ